MKLVCFGSALIDITGIKVDKNFLQKYNLKEDTPNAASKEHKKLYQEISDIPHELNVGGSILNTVRILNWLQKESQENSVTFVGSVGNDSEANFITSTLDNERIKYILRPYQCNTGRVISLISEPNLRTMITDLGASKLFEIDNELLVKIKEYDALYLTALSLWVSENCVKLLVNTFKKQKKSIFVNLGAPVFFKENPDALNFMCNNADIIFGTDSDVAAFETGLSATDDLKKIISNFAKSLEQNEIRIIVITRGSKPIFVYQNGVLSEFIVPEVKSDDIVDTTGCGDAFVAGFLSKYLLRKPIGDCVNCGIFAAQEILKYYGCNFDSKIHYSE